MNEINVTSDYLIKIFEELPNEKQRNYEVTLTNLVQDLEGVKLRTSLNDILLMYERNNINDNILYAAFYCLSILYRRTKDISLLESLMMKYENKFKYNHPTFSHLYVLYLKEKGIGRDVIKVISKSYEAYKNLEDNAGVVHNFAETVAVAYEESDIKTQNLIINEWLDKAEEAIDLAIELDCNYAKYYCTKGRLLAINKKYNDAMELIKRAIDIEESTKKDYVIRLGNYQYYLLLTQTKHYSDIIAKQVEENQQLIESTEAKLEEQMKDNNIKNLEFLGFFAAIVSFTIGSIQIVNKQSFQDAGKLIVILFACLISIYGAFGLILHGVKKNTIINIIMFLIGATITATLLFT